MSWTIVGAVLFSALLHASWNALIKAGRDKALDTALIHLLGCGVAYPILESAGALTATRIRQSQFAALVPAEEGPREN